MLFLEHSRPWELTPAPTAIAVVPCAFALVPFEALQSILQIIVVRLPHSPHIVSRQCMTYALKESAA